MKVLVIDDDVALCDALKEVLSFYDVHFIHDGGEAIKSILTLRPHLILCDIKMPYSGVQVYRDIRSQKEFAHIPIILMTALNKVPVEYRSGDSLLYKPFDINKLLGLVEQVVY